jgi:integrase
MRTRLKGINSIRKQRADGCWVTYYYAWKGGPRLHGEPGTPEFIASYNQAVAIKNPSVGKTVSSLTRYFRSTSEFNTDIKPRTREDYVKQIKLIDQKFGDFPVSGLSDPRARGIFKEWRDELARKSIRQADYAWTVLARVLSVAKDRGHIKANPCERGGRLYQSERVDKIWTLDDEAAFFRSAPPHLHLPLLMGLWTGQREGDLLRLQWSNYDGTYIRLRPRKSITKRKPRGITLSVPVGEPLKRVLDEMAKRKKGLFILLNSDNQPWTEAGFRSSFGKARDRAGLSGLRFNDTRGTAVTRFALCGAEVPEIATFTGHSQRDVCAILDAHYLNRDPELARSAIRKLEIGMAKWTVNGTDSSNYAPNWSVVSKGESLVASIAGELGYDQPI